jgi:hypothetical protein
MTATLDYSLTMSVALEGHREDNSRQPTLQRLSNLAQALNKRYNEFWPYKEPMLITWNGLLAKTIVEDPFDRMDPEHLGSVRQRPLE